MARDPTVNVKVKADSRELKKLRAAGKQAFDKKTLTEFTRAAGDMEKQLADVLKRQISIVDRMKDLKKGSDTWKEWRTQLKGVNQEASEVERTLSRLRGVLRQQDQEQEKQQQKRRSFAAGMGQGLGVAQYIPADRGMAGRMAGAALGGGIRRSAGAAAAPFLTPGIGGMAQAFGAIPIVGGMAAGALQTGAGAYQQASAFAQTARGALFAQGQGISSRAMARRSALAEVQVRRVRAIGKQDAREAIRRRARLVKQVAAQKASARTTTIGAVIPGEPAPQMGAGAASEAMTDQMDRAMQEGVRTPAEFTQWLKRRKGPGTTPPTVAELGRTPEQVRQQTKQQIQSIRARARRQPTGLPGAGAGVQFGLGPQEMMQGFTQMMQARGGTYDDVRQGEFKGQMAAQVAYGVSAQQAGQVGRMGIRGGGGTGMGQGLAGVLQAAVAQGLRGSQVTEYLQTLVGLGQAAERSGVKINATEFTRSAATLGAAGLQGLQAQRVAGGMQQAAMNVSKRGVQSPIDVMLARAAGFDPSQGPEGYAAAMNKMAGGMTTDMMNKLMANMTKGAGAGGFGPEMQALMLRRAMGKMGVEVGPGQATSMLEAYRQGKPFGGDKYGEEEGAEQRLIKIARGKVRRGAGLAVAAAGLQATQIDVGSRMASTVISLEKASLNTARAISRLPINKLASAVERSTKALDNFFAGKGGSGIMGLLEDLIQAVRGGGGTKGPAGTGG